LKNCCYGIKHRGKRIFYYKYFTLNKMKEVHIMSKKILKRSLVLSALMAFVITGSAWAEEPITERVGAPKKTPYENDTFSVTAETTQGLGGVFKVDSDVTFKNCDFKDNTFNTSSTAQYIEGGVIYISGSKDTVVTIEGGSFINNTINSTKGKKERGGAISLAKGQLSITGVTFEDNTAGYRGMAIYANGSNSVITIKDSDFISNGPGNGLIYLQSGAKLILDGSEGDNYFTGNECAINVEKSAVTLKGTNKFENNYSNAISLSKSSGASTLTFAEDSNTVCSGNSGYDIKVYREDSNVVLEDGAIVSAESGVDINGNLKILKEEKDTSLALGSDSYIANLIGTGGTIKYLKDINLVVDKNEVTDKLNFVVEDGTITDAVNGDVEELIGDSFAGNEKGATFRMAKGNVVGEVTGELEKDEVTEMYVLKEGTRNEATHEGNAAISHNANIAMMAWRAETNDMNKRLGELRNANGDLGVWVRMVGGEDEFKSVNHEYTQYQLGYDEKLSVDPSWTVGVALTYTDGESTFANGSGENTHKGLSVYGSKLNDDGSFIDLIAKYSRLEHDLTSNSDKGDYSTNGYSVSAEYGKRFQQGKGLWIEPQVELTYGKVKSAEYKLGDKTVSQDAMESLVGRVGFSLGKDIKQGNVYARASYLYDFEGETNMAFANSGARREFKYDLGGGWWEVGVGANINLSKATYIYADVEKTFGGEVDTNWQWNLGVRYSF